MLKTFSRLTIPLRTKTIINTLYRSLTSQNNTCSSSNIGSRFKKKPLDPKLSLEDPLKVSSRWSEEQLQIRNTVRDFSNNYLRKRIGFDFRNNKINCFNSNREIVKEMGNLGILGVISQGMSNVVYGIIAREIESVDSAYRSTMSVQSSLVIYPISKYGLDSVKNDFLDGLCSGDLVGCFGLTEPNHGSDPSSMITKAKRENKGYVLNGEKTWITNSPLADVFIVWCKDTSNQDKISGFVLHRDDKGISTPVIHNKLSLNASITGQIVMDNVWIPEDRKLNVDGLKGPFSCLNQARFGISWGVLGSAVDSLEVAREYTGMRSQFGKSLSEFQLIQTKLANYTGRVGMALSACQQLAELRDKKEDTPEMVSILKAQNCQLALETAQNCRDMLGGNGIIDDYSPIRHLMNLQAVCTYEGTTDIHNLIVGRSLTGYSAFY